MTDLREPSADMSSVPAHDAGRAPRRTLHPGQQVSLGDAKHGATVLLDDGTHAELQWVSRNHKAATVRQAGRHLRIPAARIVRVVKRGDQL